MKSSPVALTMIGIIFVNSLLEMLLLKNTKVKYMVYSIREIILKTDFFFNNNWNKNKLFHFLFPYSPKIPAERDLSGLEVSCKQTGCWPHSQASGRLLSPWLILQLSSLATLQLFALQELCEVVLMELNIWLCI